MLCSLWLLRPMLCCLALYNRPSCPLQCMLAERTSREMHAVAKSRPTACVSKFSLCMQVGGNEPYAMHDRQERAFRVSEAHACFMSAIGGDTPYNESFRRRVQSCMPGKLGPYITCEISISTSECGKERCVEPHGHLDCLPFL